MTGMRSVYPAAYFLWVYRLFERAVFLGSPTGYALEREISAKQTEGCRLRLSKAVESSEVERAKRELSARGQY